MDEDSHLTLHTTCPDRHAVATTRRAETWRLALDTASAVLWCHSCGLQFHASEPEMDHIARRLSQMTRPDAQQRGCG